MSHTFNVTITVAKEFETFADIIVTGVEGGINYWAEILAYKHECQPSETFARVREIDEITEYDISTGVIAHAIHIMLDSPDAFYPSTGGNARSLALAIITEATDLDYDAGDADCMIQIGLFGKVVYG